MITDIVQQLEDRCQDYIDLQEAHDARWSAGEYADGTYSFCQDSAAVTDACMAYVRMETAIIVEVMRYLKQSTPSAVHRLNQLKHDQPVIADNLRSKLALAYAGGSRSPALLAIIREVTV